MSKPLNHGMIAQMGLLFTPAIINLPKSPQCHLGFRGVPSWAAPEAEDRHSHRLMEYIKISLLESSKFLKVAVVCCPHRAIGLESAALGDRQLTALRYAEIGHRDLAPSKGSARKAGLTFFAPALELLLKATVTRTCTCSSSTRLPTVTALELPLKLLPRPLQQLLPHPLL